MPKTVSLQDKEKEDLLKLFAKLDKQTLIDLATTTAEVVSRLARGFEGKAIEPKDIITRFTNVKDILERSRFPTYPLLAKQVYLRLIAKYHPECYHFEDWANLEAAALISYKGKSREEYVESIKAATRADSEQQFYLGERKVAEPERRKTRFWSRKPKTEESEFENQ